MRNLPTIFNALRLLSVCTLIVEIYSRENDMAYREGDEHISTAPRIKFKKPRISMSTMNTMNALLPPMPTEWPSKFSVMFYSNITSLETLNSVDALHAVKGLFSYSDISGLRISHGPGGIECFDAFASPDGCSLQVERTRIFVQFVKPNTERTCCLNQEIGSSVTKEWPVHGFVYNATRRIISRICHGFRRHDLDSSFTFWADASTHAPCAITFDKEPRQDWYFEPKSLRLEEEYLAPSLYDRSDCQSRCPTLYSIPSIGLWSAHTSS